VKKDYNIKLFYIHQDPSIAWSFTLDREKIEKRAIRKDSFIDTYFEIFENLDSLFKHATPSLTVDVVIKDKNNKIGRWHENVSLSEIDALIGKRYNKEQLKRILS
jgi:hypothetical protein